MPHVTEGQARIDFILARIAEDEGDVLDRGIHPGAPRGGVGASLTSWEQRRWLAECEAKRRIVAEVLVGHLLVLPYVDHPDFREEWLRQM